MRPDADLAVLRLIADGERHSGETLAATLGVSRAAVWKQLESLRRSGLEIDAVRGAGYRLARPLELLDAAAIRASLSEHTRPRIERLALFATIDSTNTCLLAGRPPAPGTLAVCLAEVQRAGRGRRGRAWIAPLGAGLCLSVAWVFETQPADLPALGLAVGVVARRVLVDSTGLRIQLKWPNDLLVDDRKLGGILVELAAESHGPCFVVIGIGINVTAAPELSGWTSGSNLGAVDLAAALHGEPPSRNRLAAGLIDGLAELLAGFGEDGFARYHAAFVEADYLAGRRVVAEGARAGIEGRAIGIGADGTLLIETAHGVSKVVAGEVSVRPGA
jgi:BirA family biotin operon repressor/biotin-[acetyl-CoA-carboxylase] ligase